MSNDQVTNAFVSAVGLALLWHQLFVLWPGLFRDKYRQDMFALRDELFDAARAGKVPFDAPAYVLIRTTMNGYIRFAHRLSLCDGFFLSVALRPHPETALGIQTFEELWQRSVASMSAGQVQVLGKTVHRMRMLTVRYMLIRSPLLTLCVVPIVLGVLVVRERGRRLRTAISGRVDDLAGKVDTAARAIGDESLPMAA